MHFLNIFARSLIHPIHKHSSVPWLLMFWTKTEGIRKKITRATSTLPQASEVIGIKIVTTST
ncbi:unnamed protein product [Larinioides sclopetarius]|uniref:Uncharacterized protein n=1 Tax=Larinioides sclopetarius TaxID=280406 RepID=A0AAV1Z4T7_9ARAC